MKITKARFMMNGYNPPSNSRMKNKVSMDSISGYFEYTGRDEAKDVEKEVMRFQKARQKALQELRDLYDLAAKDVGEANAAIFEMQQMILEDQEIIRQFTSFIVEH